MAGSRTTAAGRPGCSPDAADSGSTMRKVSPPVSTETTVTSRQITLITSQQRTATEQVTQSVNEIQQFTRQAVNGAKQSRAAAADLLRTTGHLDELLSGKNGAALARPVPAPPAAASPT